MSDEPSTLDLLDAYLAELHSGQPDRARWLAEHPELAPHLECLDRLDEIAPPRTLDPDATLAPAPLLTPAGPAASFADGRFELIDELGRGGMGVVYRARQAGLERIVALKMVLAGSMASDEQLRRFAAEAKVAARVQHPNVVPVHETGQINGLPYLVMQYVEGRSLAEKLRAGPVPVEAAVRCVAAVARAVAALHAHGIVHRDLKPSNILLDAQDRPYVTDFGLARLVEGDNVSTQSGTILGTPQYMAPEQVTNAKRAGPAADVYALGAILYECLTGRPAFRADTQLDTILAVLEKDPEPPRQVNPKLPRVLERVILQCLDKQAENRYASATALAHALECYLTGGAVPTRRPGPVEWLRRWGRREPALVSRLAALGLFSGVVLYNYYAMPDKRTLTAVVQLLLVAWAVVSGLCQTVLRWPGWGDWAAYAWSAADVLLLTLVQLLTKSYTSPLIVGYPFLVACAGLWTKRRMVWVTTAFTLIGYACLIPRDLDQHPGEHPPHQHLIFLASLAVLGFVMAYQVDRIRALSRYFDRAGD